MVPLPAQGHLNQLLQLSHLIAAYDIDVHYASTAAHNRQALQRAHPLAAAANVQFDDLPFPEYQSPNPNPNAANKFPSHLQPLFDAARHLRRPLAALLRSLSSSADRVVVIHDSLMSSVVQDAASIPNAESYVFHSVSAFAVFLYFCQGLPTFPMNLEIPSLDDCFTREFTELMASEHKYLGLDSGSLFNTCTEMEGEFIDKISKYKCKKIWAVGPLNPVVIKENEHECLQWLNMQEENSVVLVSFGTTSSFSEEEMKELANGLEESGVKFIWIWREADRGDSAVVGEGLEKRGVGIVVRDWAPQLEILGHPATGGFLSHCGWNSCMESISMGKPIGAWPMHSDQPRNAVLITELLRVGMLVRPWGQRKEVLRSPEIARGLRTLMEGAEMRRRAQALGAAVRRAVAEGIQMDSFVHHITR